MRRPDRFVRQAMGLTLGASLLLVLAGCVTQALRSEFGYNAAYAEILNKQLLLNLARLDNGHPPQFLAVGAIQSHYNFAAGASGGINQSHAPTTTEATTQGFVGKLFEITGRTVTTVSAFILGSNGSVSAAATSEPEFTWIPLNNQEVTQQILDPLEPDVFYTLYQQGFPIDQLMRVTVERIEISLPDGGYLTLTNSPTRSGRIDKNVDWESFSRFLRTCAMLRELQRRGWLHVDTTPEFVPLSDAVFDHREINPPKLSDANGGADAGQKTATLTPAPKSQGRAGGAGRTGPLDVGSMGNVGQKNIPPFYRPPATAAPPIPTPKPIITPSKFTPIATATPAKVATAKPATAKPATAKPATAKPATAKPATAKPVTSTPSKTSERTAPAGPLLIAAWGADEKGFKPTPDELIAADKAGLVFKKVMETVDGQPVEGYQLGRYIQVPTFRLLRSEAAKAKLLIMGNPDLIKDNDKDEIAAAGRLFTVLLTGFTIQGKLKEPGAPTTKTHLILRSFSHSLEGVASEQSGFAALLKLDKFKDSLPEIEKRPILKTRFTDGEHLESPLVKLSYMGKTYQITDEVNPNGADLTRTWNRDVYRLLMALSSQVTVDISQFQRQVIELQQ